MSFVVCNKHSLLLIGPVYQAYLLPALDRPNLKVLPGAYVCRIVTEVGNGGVVARAVEFEYNGKRHIVSAAREVIVSAGLVICHNI